MAAPTTPTNAHGLAPRSPEKRTPRTMRRLLAASPGVALALGALTLAAPSSDSADAQSEAASPTTGQVVVFETETTEMTAFNNPDDCNNAPALAHTIVNHTDQAITLYADDRCGTPLVEVAPGFGSHVAPGQSFSTFEAAVTAAETAAPQPNETPPSKTGQVMVFETELNALTAFVDPRACNNAPALAHTIMNYTDSDITLFADDRCGVELIDVRPGFGSHVAPDQSFAAID